MKNNNNSVASVNVASVEKKEEVAMMTVKELRAEAKELGIVGYSRMSKATLIAAIEERKASEVVDPVVEEPVVEEKPVKEAPVVDEELMKFLKAISVEIMSQTLKRNANGELVLREFALFYKATKSDCKDYMALGKRLWGVVSKVVGNLYGEANKTSKVIQRAIDKMVECGLVTKQSSERTYVTLNPATMSQDEKDQLNNLWRAKDIKTEKVKDMVKATAITDNGKAVLNQLYPNWVYTATSEQMNTMFRLSK